MTLIIKTAGGACAELKVGNNPKDLWDDTVEFWLEDDNSQLLDYCKFRISKKHKFFNFRKS